MDNTIKQQNPHNNQSLSSLYRIQTKKSPTTDTIAMETHLSRELNGIKQLVFNEKWTDTMATALKSLEWIITVISWHCSVI